MLTYHGGQTMYKLIGLVATICLLIIIVFDEDDDI